MSAERYRRVVSEDFSCGKSTYNWDTFASRKKEIMRLACLSGELVDTASVCCYWLMVDLFDAKFHSGIHERMATEVSEYKKIRLDRELFKCSKKLSRGGRSSTSKCNELPDDRVARCGSVNYGATRMEVAA
ncbi:hypothetical protein ANTQUA_LOCUS4838 [Anthophora quadrimaculata]